MNGIGEKIDMEKAKCREMYIPDLMALHKSERMKDRKSAV